MSVMVKVALRNMREHKSKTLIIGIIIAMGITVLIVGNSMLDTAAAGIEKSYINNYTGHCIIHAATEGDVSLFGTMTLGDPDSVTPTIPRYDVIESHIETVPSIEKYNPQISGRAMVSWNNQGNDFMQFFGIDPVRYRRMFPDNVEIIEGAFLGPAQEGVMVSETMQSILSDSFDARITVGDTLLLTGMNPTSGTKIREVTVRAVFRFKESNMQLDRISFIDLTNLRVLNGMTVQGTDAAQLSETEKQFLQEIDEEALFSIDEDDAIGEPASVSVLDGEEEVSEGALFDVLGDTTERDGLTATDSQAYHFIPVKFSQSNRVSQTVEELNRFFQEEGIEAEATYWIDGAGIVAEMANSIQVAFNIVILVIAVVAIIIIMNTLVISVTERIEEIGTMRAIGATKGDVRRMISWETLLISSLFGALGLLIGTIILAILSLTGIEAPNQFFQILFGGSVLRPVLTPGAIGLSLVTVTGIGVLSSLSPVSVALKIKPFIAMHGR